MTEFFSAISGQFGRALIISAFLPVAVFVFLWLLLVEPLIPQGLPFTDALRALDTQWQLLVVAFTAIAGSVVLLALNQPILLLHEGYGWEKTIIGTWLTKREQKYFDALHSRVEGLRTLALAQREAQSTHGKTNELRRAVGISLNTDIPRDRTSVLPTRLGNVIRSAETYPRHQYQIAGPTLWFRLSAKIPKEYATEIENAKMTLDFTLNAAVLSCALALSLIVTGLIQGTPFMTQSSTLIWLLEVAIAICLAWLFRSVAVNRAKQWGMNLRSTFDLYRGALLKDLGYEGTPATRAEERDLWYSISQQLVYGDHPAVWPHAYQGHAIAYSSSKDGPYAMNLQVVRGIFPADKNGSQIVTIKVTNADDNKRTAPKVVVLDRLPEKHEFHWGSASIRPVWRSGDGTPRPIECPDPPASEAAARLIAPSIVEFQAGCLMPGDHVTISYRVIPAG